MATHGHAARATVRATVAETLSLCGRVLCCSRQYPQRSSETRERLRLLEIARDCSRCYGLSACSSAALIASDGLWLARHGTLLSLEAARRPPAAEGVGEVGATRLVLPRGHGSLGRRHPGQMSGDRLGAHGSSWELMGACVSSWELVGARGSSWELVGAHGSSCELVGAHGSSWGARGSSWGARGRWREMITCHGHSKVRWAYLHTSGAIRSNQEQSEALEGAMGVPAHMGDAASSRKRSEAHRSDQERSGAIRSDQKRSEAIRSTQKQPEALRSNQKQ